VNGRLRAPGIDRVLMLAVVALVTLGTLLVWSATTSPAATPRRT
jgi:rod shape determining protein RodA